MGQIKYTFVVLCTVIIACVWCADVPEDYYNSRYDAVDIDDILNHKRLVNHYAACLLNRGPCPPQGKDLKGVLPEALETKCSRCTEKQKYVTFHLITRLKNEYPRLWKELQDAYDPTGQHTAEFESTFLNNQGPTNNNIGPTDNNANEIGLFNRFGNDDDLENNVAGTLKPLSSSPPIIVMVTSPPSTQSVPSETNIQNVATKIHKTTTYSPVIIFDVDSGIKILGQISEFGNRVIKAGTQVADMFLSTVNSFIGN